MWSVIAMEIGLHIWDIVAWSCFGGSLASNIVLELPLLFYWWLNLLIFRLCIGSLRGTMPYKISSDEERGCIVGMREGGMKSSNIASVLNVPRSTVSTILTNWKVRGSIEFLKPRCGRHRKLSDRDARVLACYVRDDRRQSMLELSSLLNVSRNTTRSFLHDLAFRNSIASKKNHILVRSTN